eukprot:4503011-Ditylum_brightwellii.AAC.1
MAKFWDVWPTARFQEGRKTKKCIKIFAMLRMFHSSIRTYVRRVRRKDSICCSEDCVRGQCKSVSRVVD